MADDKKKKAAAKEKSDTVRKTTSHENGIRSEKTVEEAKKLGMMDDLFFNKMMEDPAVCEEIISTCLKTPVKVKRVIPQSTITSLQNKGVRLDAFAEAALLAEVKLLEDCPIGPEGFDVNVELQKSNKDDYQKRMLYNAGAVMLNRTPKNTKRFRDIRDVVVIMISSFDVFKKGKAWYRVKRVIEVDGNTTEVFNGMWEYYVNTEVKDDNHTPEMKKISDLMKVFSEPERYDSQFPATSERKRQFRNTEKGVFEMSDSLQKYIDEEVEKAVNKVEEEKKEILRKAEEDRKKAEKEKEEAIKAVVDLIKNAMESFGITLERAMESLKIPQDKREMYMGLLEGN